MKAFRFIPVALLALTAIVACSKDEKDNGDSTKKSSVTVSLTATSKTFNNNSTSGTLNLSEASDKDVTVLLEAGGTLADRVSFTKEQTIKAGSKQVKFLINLDPEGLPQGEQNLVLSIATATAEIDEAASSVEYKLTVSFPSVGLTLASEFADGKATVEVVPSIKPLSDVTVTLGLGSIATVADATLIDSKLVSFQKTVTLVGGSTDAVSVTVNVDDSELEPGLYEVPIEIVSVSDNAVIGTPTQVSFTVAGHVKANLRSDWSVSYGGTREESGETVDVLNIAGTGDTPFYVYIYTQGAVAESFATVTDYIRFIEDNRISPNIGTEDAEHAYTGENEILLSRLSVGSYEVFILGADATGHLSGDYATCNFTLEPTPDMLAAYDLWLGDWGVAGAIWTIAEKERGASYTIHNVDNQEWDIEALLNWDGGLEIYNQESVAQDGSDTYGFCGLAGTSLWYGSFVICTGTLNDDGTATLIPATAPNGETFSSMAFLQFTSSSIYLAGSQISLPCAMGRVVEDTTAEKSADFADYVGSWIYNGTALQIKAKVAGRTYTISGLPGNENYGDIVANYADGVLYIMEQKLGSFTNDNYGACDRQYAGTDESGYPGFGYSGGWTTAKKICTLVMHESGNAVFVPGEYDTDKTFAGMTYCWVITEAGSQYIGRGNWTGNVVFVGSMVPSKAASVVAPARKIRRGNGSMLLRGQEKPFELHAMNSR